MTVMQTAPRPEGSTQAKPRNWLRLSIDAYRHPKIANLTDAQFRALIVALSEGKRSSPEGTWQSHRHMRECLGLHARHIPALIRAGLVDEVSGGGLEIHDWQDWQTDRHARYRAAHRDELKEREKARRDDGRGDEPGDARGDALATVRLQETKGDERQETRDEGDVSRLPLPRRANPFATYEQLTGQRLGKGDRIIRDLVGLHDHDRVDRALRDEYAQHPTPVDLLDRLRVRLDRERPAGRIVVAPTPAEQLDDFRRDPAWIDGQYAVHEVPNELQDAYQEHLAQLKASA